MSTYEKLGNHKLNQPSHVHPATTYRHLSKVNSGGQGVLGAGHLTSRPKDLTRIYKLLETEYELAPNLSVD